MSDKKKATQVRPENGAMCFGNDWPGTFVRGDSAMYYAMILNNISEMIKDHADIPHLYKIQLQSLINLLGSAGYTPDMTVQKMVNFDEAFIEEQVHPDEQKERAKIQADLEAFMKSKKEES